MVDDSREQQEPDGSTSAENSDSSTSAETAQADLDAAQAALNRMREAAQSRGERRVRNAAAHHKSQAKNRGGGAGQLGRSGSADSEKFIGRDPQGLAGIVSRMVAERGWSSPVAVGSVIAQWNVLVGAEIAAHCQPESFNGTVLHVRCDSTSWATQLRLLSSTLLARFEADLGAGVVTKIQVLGPTAPNWRKGGRTVNGRGPRDTYG